MSGTNSFLGTPQSIAGEFLDALIAAGYLEEPDRAATHARLMRAFESISAANAAHYPDEQGRRVSALAASVLACRNAALDVLHGDRQLALELLSGVLIDPRRPAVKQWLESRMGITEADAGGAFREASLNFKPRGEAVFGAAFTYEQEARTPERSFVNVTKCAFNDFFRRNGAPELTSLFCALDTLWADYLNAGPFNVSFRRPTVLSAGDDACRFQFTRRELPGRG